MKRRFIINLISFALGAALLLSLAVTAAFAAPAGSGARTVNFTNAAPLVEPPSLSNPANADGAAAAANDPFNLAKNVTPNGNGTYKVSLEAFATGSITSGGEASPADIVLVIDQSTSMAWTWANKMPVYDDPSNPLDTTGLYEEGETKYRDADGNELKRVGENWVRKSDESSIHVPKISPEDNTEGHEQFYVSRLNAMRMAVRAFIDKVHEASSTGINHRIAVVGFGYGGGELNYGNTELFIGNESYAYPEASGHYGSAFMEVQSNSDILKNTIVKNFSAKGTTCSNLGLEMAKGILEANPIQSGEQRKQVVILFTDGQPTTNGNFGWKMSGSDNETDAYTTANAAITNAKAIKEAGATVYSVGIFTGANGSTSGDLPTYTGNLFYDENDAAAIANGNRYMHLVSSNYPNATDMQNPGDINPNIPTGKGYYLSAADSNNLTDIFESISGEITNVSTNVGEEAVTLDKLSQYFQLPAGTTANDIKVFTADAKAGAHNAPSEPANWADRQSFTATVNVDADTGEVKVSGFDFSANFVSVETHPDPLDNGNTGFYGRKLIIEFNIEPKTGFLGGNNVPTNDEDSGIYANEEATNSLQAFEVPKANVEIPEIAAVPLQKNVYLYGSLTKEQLLEGAKATTNDGVTIKYGKTNYGLESWQYDFVNIAFDVSVKDGENLPDDGIVSDITGDVVYNYTVKVEPKETPEGGVQYKAATNSIGVFVFCPTVTFKDSEVEKGDTINLTENYVAAETVWKHGSTLASTVNMIGPAPELAFTYTVQTEPTFDAGNGTNYTVNFDKDTYVKVTAKIDEHELTVTGDKLQIVFLHENCTIVGSCPLNGSDNTNSAKGQFILHILECTLTVVKQDADNKKFTPGESFIFTITKDGDGDFKPIKIVLYADKNGNVDPVKIVGLAPGTYTVTEDSGWCWRFELVGSVSYKVGEAEPTTESVTLNGGDNGTATAANKRSIIKWLSWDTHDVNKWNENGIEHVQVPEHGQAAS